MRQPPSLYVESTELSADSVESHPLLPYTFAVSTYQVDQDTETDAASPSYSRRGRCCLHRAVRDEDGLHCQVLAAVSGAAILDTKWCLAGSANPEHALGLLGIADATGHITLHRLEKATELQFTTHDTWQMNGENALCLSLDWSDRAPFEETCTRADARLICSQSNGKLVTVPSVHAGTKNGIPLGLESWLAHEYESWIAAWDCWSNGAVVWSGGDDLALRGWDLRQPMHDGARPTTFSTTKCFQGGVTSIQSHAFRQHCWAVGSYDEKLRIFDARNTQRPVSETEVGGGIWRTKWHPTRPDTILLGCMHGGFQVLQDTQPAAEAMEVVCHFDAHNSIAYGCDWERGMLQTNPDEDLVYSCSFYDATLRVWAWA
ncbi:methylated diphthine methylhydrolase [Malassezia vespertilionis]|uniref:methylated diphthine methylhydrolase n=1 Tax=Malassezia vespertilionis TaxID=2020962 RepID=UPI0024B12EF2|nr:methylated diphthine methylhydrolase [Malassezia vespertilionis]WFD06227.1 methylated diphthine methylhydrolase [Malassezia vespertilionis]